MPAPISGPFADLKIVDTDTHYSEPYDLWTAQAPAKYRDLVPQVKENEKGERFWHLQGVPIGRAGAASIINRDGVKEAYWAQDISGGRPREEVHPASYDPDSRLEMMDKLGIWANIVYPNFLGFNTGRLIRLAQEDPDLAHAVIAAYNDHVADWQVQGKGRLFPQAVIPFWNIEETLKETQRACGELGLKGITMSGQPHLGGLPDLAEHHWDPFYELISELEIPINIHVGSSIYDPATHHSGLVWPSLDARALRPIDSVEIELANSRFLTNLLVSDILIRYPKLKFVSVESGIGWIPYVLERIDYQFFEKFPGVDDLDRPTAHELWHSNVYGCFWFEVSGPKYLLDTLGADNVMWESDFPHLTCLYPEPLERSEPIFDGVSPEKIRKVMQDNAFNLYKLPKPSEETSL